jgi:hypothetical protein
MAGSLDTPILVPIETDEFWEQIRLILREELSALILRLPEKTVQKIPEENGLQYKPLYDMKELRQLFSNVSRTTIYEWVRCGKLKPKKMRGKVFFLWIDIEKLLKEM